MSVDFKPYRGPSYHYKMKKSGSGDCLLVALNSAMGPPLKITEQMMNMRRVAKGLDPISGFWTMDDIRYLIVTGEIQFFLRRVSIRSSAEFRSLRGGVFLVLGRCAKQGQLCNHAFVVDCESKMILDGFHKRPQSMKSKWESYIKLQEIHRCFMIFKFNTRKNKT